MDEGASPAPAVRIGPQRSGVWNRGPAIRNSESRVGSGPARARQEWQLMTQIVAYCVATA